MARDLMRDVEASMHSELVPLKKKLHRIYRDLRRFIWDDQNLQEPAGFVLSDEREEKWRQDLLFTRLQPDSLTEALNDSIYYLHELLFIKELISNIWEKRRGSLSKKKGIEEIAAVDGAMTVNLELAFLKHILMWLNQL